MAKSHWLVPVLVLGGMLASHTTKAENPTHDVTIPFAPRSGGSLSLSDKDSRLTLTANFAEIPGELFVSLSGDSNKGFATLIDQDGVEAGVTLSVRYLFDNFEKPTKPEKLCTNIKDPIRWDTTKAAYKDKGKSDDEKLVREVLFEYAQAQKEKQKKPSEEEKKSFYVACSSNNIQGFLEKKKTPAAKKLLEELTPPSVWVQGGVLGSIEYKQSTYFSNSGIDTDKENQALFLVGLMGSMRIGSVSFGGNALLQRTSGGDAIKRCAITRSGDAMGVGSSSFTETQNCVTALSEAPSQLTKASFSLGVEYVTRSRLLENYQLGLQLLPSFSWAIETQREHLFRFRMPVFAQDARVTSNGLRYGLMFDFSYPTEKEDAEAEFSTQLFLALEFEGSPLEESKP